MAGFEVSNIPRRTLMLMLILVLMLLMMVGNRGEMIGVELLLLEAALARPPTSVPHILEFVVLVSHLNNAPCGYQRIVTSISHHKKSR